MIALVALGKSPLADEYRALVRGIARTSCETDTFDRHAYDPTSVRHARRHWETRMMDEYLSTAVYSGLSAQLLEANASLDANAVLLRMAQDEFRHAELCGRVAVALGGTNVAARDTSLRPLPRHPRCSPEERALRNVIVTSISEMYSVAFFVESLDRMADPYLRSVTRSLLADEILHGRFAFYFLEDWSGWLAARPEVRASISDYLRLAFATCERELVGEEWRRPVGADDDALGLVPAAVARDVFRDSMERAVAPGLDRFGLDASAAWADARQ